MKKPEIKISKHQIRHLTDKTSWEKAVFWSLIFVLVALLLGNLYLLFRPLDSNISDIVKKEINSANITFDKKILESLKDRQQPQQTTGAATGKNPFTPF